MKTWYQINAAKRDDAPRHAEILIYSPIGSSMWEETVDARTFVAELAELDVDTIDVRLNSPGGSVFDGNAIYNALVRHRAEVTTYIDGCAASIASIIALAGDRVVMAPNAMLMIHNPWSFAIGEAADLRKTADMLDKLRGSLIGTYATKTLLDEDTIAQMMDAETWIDADEAIEYGFAQHISETHIDASAAAQWDAKALAHCKNVPAAVAALAHRSDGDTSDDEPHAEVWQVELARAARLREQAS